MYTNHFGKTDLKPDLHQSEKLDLDPHPHRSHKTDPHQSQNKGAVEAQNWSWRAVNAYNEGVEGSK